VEGTDTSDTAEPASPTPFRLLPGSGRAGVAVVVGTGLACYGAQWVAVTLRIPPAQLSTVWIPAGLMLAVALVTERRRWPAVITAATIGMSLAFLTLRVAPPHADIVLALLVGFHTVVLASVLRAVLGRPFALTTLREFLTYLGVAVVGGALVASILLLAVSWGMRFRPPTFLVWGTFALSVVMGYLTTTPTVVLLVQEVKTLRRASGRRWLEAGLLALLLTLASGLVHSGMANRAGTWAAYAMTFTPLLLWAAVRFGTLGASASLLLVTLVSTRTASRGLGPFTSASPGEHTLSVQLFILGTGLPLQGLAVVLREQKRTRAALQSSHLRLRGLNQRLIAAREEEASRIARELHDDVGQQLALVAIGLSRLQARAVAPGDAAVIARLKEQTSSIARSLRQISHQLHPAVLEHVGLVAALELKCEEVREATGVNVRMVNGGDTSAIPRDVALCLFRVAQEALSNVVRHSGARRVDLSLRREGAELLLDVADDGRGFTVGAPDQGTGLGLRSAAERVRAVGGALTVGSEPGAGTRFRATVPLGVGA
jgi:signal transduction histidine kinase